MAQLRISLPNFLQYCEYTTQTKIDNLRGKGGRERGEGEREGEREEEREGGSEERGGIK